MPTHNTLPQLAAATLACQGLAAPAAFGTGKAAVLKAVRHLGYVQIDTLSVVARAHHHTLWARIPDYQADDLAALVAERQLFEYWFHAAAYLPMANFRFALPQMLAYKRHQSPYYRADPKVMQYVLDTIRAEGPQKARDFESNSQKTGSWWNWKPTKLALERLFMQGDLMVCGRSGMQKTYDLSERVLPPHLDTREPTPAEFAEYLVHTYLRAYGCTTLKQIMHLKTGTTLRRHVNEVLQALLAAGEIEQFQFDGLPALFVQRNLMVKPAADAADKVHILSPFDNALIHRERFKHLFGVDFRIECYLPQAKRQYGYFCLPLLWRGEFIGRMDCKAHRQAQRLEIIHLHMENTAVDMAVWWPLFAAALKRFAAFNGCDSWVLTQVSPAKWADALRQAMAEV